MGQSSAEHMFSQVAGDDSVLTKSKRAKGYSYILDEDNIMSISSMRSNKFKKPHNVPNTRTNMTGYSQINHLSDA